MENKKLFAEEMIKKLQSSAYMVSLGTVEGIDLEATMNEVKVVFHHRLSAFARPTRQEAVAVLSKLSDYYVELYRSSASFREFVGSRQFEAELYVFSGQMDFTVATMGENGLSWHVDLDD